MLSYLGLKSGLQMSENVWHPSWQRGRKMVTFRTVGVVIDYQVVSLETHTKSSKRILCGLKSESFLTSLNIFISLKCIYLHSIKVSTV